MSTAKQTHNHTEIKAWVEGQSGVPAIIKNTHTNNSDGLLRIHFPKHSNDQESFEEISWDKFFEELDANQLDFLYQEEKKSGEDSTFHKFVERTH